ncbi:MAG: Rpn family recombination-promoting nuclease/putative transposase, partial [Bacteroidia bacterium]|nr:Rpn family recombination-promoting nuclease/putative transposase [Bacteroidia bacterium]
KLFLKYVQLPVFQKAETELSDRKEQWLYYLKHLEEMEQIPQIFKSDKIFIKGLKIAEIAALSEPEFQTYQLSRMQYLEIRGVVETAYDEGILDAEKKYIPLLTEAQEIAEEERRQKEENQKIAEEERRQKEEERRQKEEERRQKEHLFQKQRKLILKMLSEGESQANVAAFFEISEAELAEIIKE